MIGAGVGLMQLAARQAGGGEDPATIALAQRMSPPPAIERRVLINTLIVGLKADDIWTKLDWLLILAAHNGPFGPGDGFNGLLNWVADKQAQATTGTTFTGDRGYAGDGASGTIDLQEPAQTGGRFKQNSATLGVWCNAAGATEGRVLAGANDTVFITGRNTGTVALRLNQGTSAPLGTVGWLGHRTAVRQTINLLESYINGSADGASGSAFSAAPTLNNLTGLAWTSSHHTNARLAALYSGSALTASQVGRIDFHLRRYLLALGAS